MSTRTGTAGLACTLLAVAGAPAQTSFVVPRECAALDGNAADLSPFGRDRCRHVQYVAAAALEHVPPGTRVRGIAYRSDASVRRPQSRQLPAESKPRPLWAVRLADWDGDVADPPCAYPAATDPRWPLYFLGHVDFPDLEPPAAAVAPFSITFPLARPFVRGSGGLGIEHHVYHRKEISYPYVVDAVEARGEPGTAVPLVAGAMPGESVLARATAVVPPLPGTVALLLFGAPPRTRVELWLERTDAAAPARRLAASTDALGTASLHWPVPGGAGFGGSSWRARWQCDAGPDRGGPVGLPLQLTFGAERFPSAVHMAVIAGYPDSEVAQGFVQRGRGLVVALLAD